MKNFHQRAELITTIKNCLLILLGAFLISVSASLPLSLPLVQTDIPGTWQTFAVLTFAYFTSPKIGVGAVLLYLLVGILGLPIFADGAQGFEVIRGNTGGYLYGFAIGALIVTLLNRRYPKKTFLSGLFAMSAGTGAILICGVAHLSLIIGLENALKFGLYPFLLGAAIKIILGATIAPMYYKIKTQMVRY